jgi:U3 small nucleolar RNA-associated protein 11
MSGRNPFKNHLKQTDYKERGQIRGRLQLGLLEKKKDYKLRSNDYKKKQNELKKLRTKAALKNDDEYYKRMHTSHLSRRGAHIDERKDTTHSRAERVQVKVHDLAYLALKAQTERGKIDRLRANLQLLDADAAEASGRKHVVFADSADAVRSFDAAAHFNTVPELVGRSYNRLTVDQLESGNVVVNKSLPKGGLASADRERKKAYAELQQRLGRVEEVQKVQKKLSTHKKLLEGGRVKALVTKDIFGDVQSKEYKWKAERKR